MALAKRVEVVVYSLALKTKDNLLPSTHCPPPQKSFPLNKVGI